MFGQINRGTKTGDFIYDTCLQKDIINIVEIGTWNGLGSTKCIADAILSRLDDSNLITLETNIKMYDQATNFWSNVLLPYNSFFKEKLNFIYGRIIEQNEIITLQEIRSYKNYVQDWEIWYTEDIENIKKCPNVMNQLPDTIDLLLLDGGEFSTLAEFNKLKSRSKYIFCDDTNTTKCSKISKELLNDESYTLIFNNQNDGRNGFMGFRRIK